MRVCLAFVVFVFGNGLSGSFHMFFCRCLDGWSGGGVLEYGTSTVSVFGFGSLAYDTVLT